MTRKTGFILLVAVAGLLGWYQIQNLHSNNMTSRQKILKTIYPVLSFLSSKKNLRAEKGQKPVVSFYELQAVTIDNGPYHFSQLKGKKVLLVNTASDCGYTAQYEALQQLYEQQKERLVILAFPANDFKDQESGDNEAIANFCKVNYGVSFPVMSKSVVIKKTGQNNVFQWLTNRTKNGWNDMAPEWNFSKYLVNEKGELTHYFSPGISPLGKEIRNALTQ